MLTLLLRFILLVGAVAASVNASFSSRMHDPLHALFFAACTVLMLVLFVHPNVLTGGTRG